VKCIISDQVVLSRPPEGPLAVHLASFSKWANEQGYALCSLRQRIRIVAGFSWWLAQKAVRLRTVSSGHAAQYLRYRAQRRRICEGDATALRQLLDFLRDKGVIPAEKTHRRPSAVELCAQAFERYLREERLLAKATIVNYMPFIREFLKHRFGNGPIRLSRLCAEDVVRFVQRRAPQLHLKRAKLLTTALRSFLRYVRYRGDVRLDLAAAVPRVANWSMSSIPRAIAPDRVRRLLAQINRGTAVGRRDYAILLLLARLGLRSGEVAFLELEAIDWKAGSLRVQGKAGRRIQCPCQQMSAERSSRICGTDDHTASVVACFCGPELLSVAFWVRVPLERSFGMHSCVPVSILPPKEPTSFAMDWPLRCCARAPRSARSASCWAIAVLRRQRSTPRSTSMRCALSPCRGREVCDEHAPTGRSLPVAAPPRIVFACFLLWQAITSDRGRLGRQ
jgi:integrase/recombinase XerD